MRNLSNLALTIKINKPVDEVWHSLVDWKGQSNWMLQTKVWSELDQDRTVKNGKGVLIFAFTGIFPTLYPKLKLGIPTQEHQEHPRTQSSPALELFRKPLMVKCIPESVSFIRRIIVTGKQIGRAHV